MDKKTEALKLAQMALSNKRASNETVYKALHAIHKALTQPEQERNFCQRCGKRLGTNDWDVHTCTPPAGKPWVGLTDEEIADIEITWEATQEWACFRYAARAIEAKLKEKNT